MALVQLTDGVLYEDSSNNAGSGSYDAFLRLQSSPIEEGFNTDQSKVLDNVDGNFTNSLRLGAIQPVTIDGISYIEIRLDLNESTNTVTLNDLKIFISGSPATLADFNNTTDTFGSGFTTVFDLSGSVSLTAGNGSGNDDYRFLVPVSLFEAAGATASSYVTLYSNFGDTAKKALGASDGGFEEWRVLLAPTEPNPVITIDKSGPPTIHEGGETATYTFTITASSTNAITDPLTIDSIVDDRLGNLTSAALAEYREAHPGATAIVLAPGESLTFSFTSGVILLNAGQSYTNIATVTSHDNENVVASAQDSHSLTASDVLPGVAIEKTASVTEITEGTATDIVYTYEVTNQSAASSDPLSVTSVVDDKLGAVTYVRGDDGDGLLEKGETWIYQATAHDVTRNAGDSLTNTVTVQATDDEGNTARATDEVTVSVADAAPQITIEKSGPEEISEGGADVTWHFTITNRSVSTDPVTLTSLADDKLGDLLVIAEEINGGPIVLYPGDSFSFDYNPAGDLVLNAGETHTNEVSVSGMDDESSEASGSDDHTITALDLAPEVKVEKSANVASITEGTPTDIVYTYKVTNESAASTDPLRIESITDDRIADVAYVDGDDGDGLLEQGEIWTYRATAHDIVRNAGDDLTNTVTVVASDDEDNEVEATAQATVTVEDAAPEITVEKTGPATIAEGGADVTWHFRITNNSVSTDPVVITDIVDDQLGNLRFIAEQINGEQIVLESGQSFEFDYNPAGNLVLNAGATHTNVVTVSGADDEGNSTSATDDHTITATDLAPAIGISKTVDADGDGVFNDSETVSAGSRSVTYRYEITNNSASTDPLTLLSLVDDRLGVISTSGVRVANSADDGDSVFEAGETWIINYRTTISLNPKHDILTNTATVVAQDDEGGRVRASDTATVESFDGPGVRTPGFWSNNGLQYWDGRSGGEKMGLGFPDREMLPSSSYSGAAIKLASGSAASMLDNAKTYLIIGGDHDNVLERGEMAISLADAASLLNASTKQQQDGRWMLGRDIIATELNLRAGNPGADNNGATVDPQHLLDDGVAWLRATTNGDQLLAITELSSGAIGTSAAKWYAPYATVDHAASVLHAQLDGFNNTGKVFNVQFANDDIF